MVGLTEITAAFGSLKAAGELAKALMGMHTDTHVRAKALELNEKIFETRQLLMDAQEVQSTLLDRIRELEEQIRQTEAWEAEKQRYELVQLGETRALTYRVKPAMQGGEPAHHICANCYNRGEKSILQPLNKHMQGDFLVCQACKAEIRSGQVKGQTGTITMTRI